MTNLTFFFFFNLLLSVILLVVSIILSRLNFYQDKDSADKLHKNNSLTECKFNSILDDNGTELNIFLCFFSLLFLLLDIKIFLEYSYMAGTYFSEIYGFFISLAFFLILTLGILIELGKNTLKINNGLININDNPIISGLYLIFLLFFIYCYSFFLGLNFYILLDIYKPLFIIVSLNIIMFSSPLIYLINTLKLIIPIFAIVLYAARDSCNYYLIILSILILIIGIWNSFYIINTKNSLFERIRKIFENIIKHPVISIIFLGFFWFTAFLIRKIFNIPFLDYIPYYLVIICARHITTFIIQILILIHEKSLNKKSIIEAFNYTIESIRLEDNLIIFIFYSLGLHFKLNILPSLDLEIIHNNFSIAIEKFIVSISTTIYTIMKIMLVHPYIVVHNDDGGEYSKLLYSLEQKNNSENNKFNTLNNKENNSDKITKSNKESKMLYLIEQNNNNSKSNKESKIFYLIEQNNNSKSNIFKNLRDIQENNSDKITKNNKKSQILESINKNNNSSFTVRGKFECTNGKLVALSLSDGHKVYEWNEHRMGHPRSPTLRHSLECVSNARRYLNNTGLYEFRGLNIRVLDNNAIPPVVPRDFIDIRYIQPNAQADMNEVILTNVPGRRAHDLLWTYRNDYTPVHFNYGDWEQNLQSQGYLRNVSGDEAPTLFDNVTRTSASRWMPLPYSRDPNLLLVSNRFYLEIRTGPNGEPQCRVYPAIRSYSRYW